MQQGSGHASSYVAVATTAIFALGWRHYATRRARCGRIAVERKGRTRAERALRERARGGYLRVAMASQGAAAAAAGVVHGTHRQRSGSLRPSRHPLLFVDRRGCPRQGALAPAAIGFLDVSAHPMTAFDGLDQFSHVWITWVFHNNTNFHKPGATQKTFRAKIRPLWEEGWALPLVRPIDPTLSACANLSA